MSVSTRSMYQTVRAQSRRLLRQPSPRLHYKHLAFGIGLALGSLLFCNAASAAQGVPATTSPTGGKVIGGVGSITQHGAETIVRQKSKLLSLDWKTFNVGKDASVLFKQPSFRAVALNRILDQNPSRIFGKISSNGQVFLINTHGIIFGASAQLNVGGLVASTLDLTPQDFLEKHFSLDAHGGHAGIVNHGTLAAASGGSISLIGGHVVNDGLIVANYGHINLDGADKAVLSFDDAGLINVEITGKLKQRFDADQGAVVNKGALHAQSGTVVLKAAAAKHLFTNLVNNSGVIKARGIRTDGGVVRLVGSGGNVMNSGSIDVSGVHGGSAQLLSDRNVGVVAGGIDASGTNGGGDIRVGGGWQGGEGLQTASATYVAPDATLNADATQSGDGGSVVVWGNHVNNFYGSISAHGGALGGDGGRAETSSHYGLNVQGRVDMAAPHGRAGTWLLDPYNLDIADENHGVSDIGANFVAVADDAIVDATSIGSALSADTSVFVFTGSSGSQAGNITVRAPIVAGGTGKLYLQAAGSIFIDADISAASSDQPIDVYLWANYGNIHPLRTTYASRIDCPDCKVVVGNSGSARIWTAGGDLHIQTGDSVNPGGPLQLDPDDWGPGIIDTSGASAGALDVKTTGISQQGTGSMIMAGAADLDAGSGSIDLASPGNNFTQAVRLTSLGDHVVLANNWATVLGPGTVAGTLDVTSNGALTQTGALKVTGDATFTQNSTEAGASQDMDLGSQANDFQSGVTFAAGTGAKIHDLLLKNTNASPGILTLPTHVGGDMTLDYTNAALALPALNVGGALNVSAVNGITLNGNITTGGMQTYNNTVDLNGGDTMLTGTQITLRGVTGHNHSLTVAGDAALNGVLTDVDNLKVSGTTALGLTGVKTTGTQDYGGQLSLNVGDTILTGTQVTLQGVTGYGYSLTIAGNATLNGALASINDLDVLGATTLGVKDVNTAGTQRYEGALALNGGDTTLTGTQIMLQGITGGNHSLTLTGETTLNGALTNVSDLKVVGTTTLGVKDVNTTGTQRYEGALALTGGDTTLTGTQVTLQGVTGNGYSLTVAGDAALNGVLAGINDLDVTGATELGVTGVNTAGKQLYEGALALNGGDTALTGTQVTLNGVTGNSHSLTVAGDATLNGVLAGINDLDVTGTTVLGATGVNTAGKQLYEGALALNGGDTALTGTQVTLNGVTGNSHSLTVAGDATLNGVLAGINDLDVTGTTVLGATDVNTTGKQLYEDALALNGGDTTLTGTRVTLQGVTGNKHSLTLTGKTTLNGTLTNVSDLKVVGPAILGVADVSTTGTQIYEGALALNGGDTALTGTAVTLNGVVGGDHDLTITGDATLNGVLTSINNLTVTGTTAFHAASVNTHGTQSYQGAATLTGGTTFLDTSGGNGAVNFGSTVDNAGSGAAQTLVVKAGTGQITFGDTVGGLQGPLDGLIVNGGTLATQALHIGAGGLSVTTAAGDLVQTGAFTVGGASSFNVGAHAITLNDKSNHFIGPVSLTNTGDHDVYLDNGGHKLTLGALSLGSGALSLVHYGSDPLLLSDSITTHGGTVHFGGAVTVDSPSAAGGTIAIDTTGGGAAGADVIFGGDVDGESSGSDNLSVDAGSAGTVSFSGDVGNSVTLGGLAVTGKRLNLPGTLAVAGDLSVTTVDALTTGTDWKGANVSLATTGANNDLTLAGNVTASNGTVSLTSKGGIHQSGGAITAGTLIGSSAGATALTGNNAIANLGGFSANGFSLTNGQALTVSGAIDAGTGSASLTTTHGALTLGDTVHAGAITLDGAGGLALNAAVDSGSGVTNLVSGGKIVENGGGTIAAGTLTGSAAGATSLAGNNTVANLGAFSANGFSLINAQALTVTGAVSGGAGATGLTTTNGALMLNGTVDGAAVVLDGHDGLAINAAVSSAGVATLNTGGAIAENGKGAIDAASLAGSSTGATHLDGANTIDSLGNFSANGFRLTNAASLAVDGTVDGGTGGTALTVTTGDLAINGTLGNTGSATILKVAGAIDEDMKGVVKANMLSGSSIGATSLTGNNQVASLGDFTADGFGFTGAQALTVAAGSTVDGGKNGTTLTVTNDNLSINGTLGNMAGTTTLVASKGAIGEGTGGVVKAKTLTGSSQGDTRLRGHNRIDALAAFSARNLALTDAHDLSVVGPVSTANGKGDISFITTTGNKLDVGLVLTGGAITLDSGSDLNVTNDIKGSAVNLAAHGSLAIDAAVDSGAGTTTLTQKGKGSISEGPAGSIVADTLTGSSAGSTTLKGTNAIANLGNFTSKGFALTNGRALTLMAGTVVDGGSAAMVTTTGTGSDVTIDGLLRGTSTRLVSAGAIGEGTGGSVQADTLSGRSAGATALTGTNAIGNLGDFTATGFTLSNGQALTVADGAVVDGGTAATLRITGANGDLAINGTVKGANTTLVSAGGIDEGAHGAVIAGTLTGRSVAATSLTGANAVANLGDFSAHGLVLNNTRSLTVADGASVNGGHATRLTTTGSGSNLTINGRVTGTATELVSAGTIHEGSGGSIHATTLAGRSAGATKLTGSNAIGSLGDFTAADLALTNGRSLTIAAGATVDGGAHATLMTTGKNSNLALNGTLKGASTALRVAGAIKEGNKGVLDTGVLTGKSVGSTTLTGNNDVAKLGNFSADGFALTTHSGLAVTAGSTVNGNGSTALATAGSGHDLDIDGSVVGDRVELASSGAIGESAAGQVRAGTLTGHSVGDTALTGANRVDSLGAFEAKDFELTNAHALVVGGPLTTIHSAGDINLTTTGGAGNTLTVKQAIHGGAITLASAGDLTVANAVTGTEVNLASNGNLAIDAAVDSATGTTTLTQKGSGGIRGGAHGSITAGTLTGSATGATMLGSSAQFMDNRVGVLGGFSSPAGFSFTNGRTLTLASVNGSAFTVDAGQSDLYLDVRNGDLLQNGTNWLYDGTGTWSASGHIGLATAPIYVTGVGSQTVAAIGKPPAYFYAMGTNGNLLPLTGASSVNIPTANLSSRSQNTTGHTDRYIDISVITAIYRSYGVVPPGILLPPDRWLCSLNRPSLGGCPENN